MSDPKDGASKLSPGGGESAGGAWKGENEKPAHPDEGVVTHIARETVPATDGKATKDH